ncbi:hypothetical protein QE418_001319 [Microbacterium testaceum]|uniref:hypothetical protein n=1 Tax=Microbacterium TaxID=33882 RepID=UPI002781ACBD|nr:MULTISPECIES: hypothetical protein [Microbacterium]MDQ1111871.1 hypothetical protein [Microbacterium testaceum]MDR6097593.1 hypothetical protein [Microbacterium sp. SORGH_AS_0454]
MAGIRPFDARALLTPPDPRAAKAFTADLRRTGRLPGTGAGVVGFALAFSFIGGIGVVIIVLAAVLSPVLREGSFILGILFLFPIVLGLGGLALAWVVGQRAQRTQEDRRWRLAGFSRDVGMEYVPAVPAPPLPGVLFGIGGDRTGYDILRGSEPRFVEIGNYAYTTSDGKNTHTSRWGYIAIRLDVPLPHIVLDAVGNGVKLGVWERGQRLSLEGDFDRYFHLSCPEGYERDALYLFTPDVMARFIDNASALEVEIVDDWMFLYSPTELSTLDPTRWAWAFAVVSALIDKLDQWGRWRDDALRASAPVVRPADAAAPAGPAVPAPEATPAPMMFTPAPVGVAPPGQRLKRSNAWLIALLVVAGAFVVVPVLLFAVGFLIFLAQSS